jgi:glutamine amidotransferase
VGEASSAMNSLQQNNLDKVIKDLKQPVLGICVGMQLLCHYSEENNTTCLGIVPVAVRKFTTVNGIIKIPQVGWNTIYSLQSHLFSQVQEDSYIYNVHSYYAEDSDYTIARCHYGVEYAAAVKKDNFYGVQFHTEKSAETGDRILQNFISATL